MSVSRFNFDDALFAATRTAHTHQPAGSRSGSQFQLNVGGGTSTLPPAPAAGYHRSGSAGSIMGDDTDTVGSLIARWGGVRREDTTASYTGPNSTHTTPRGDFQHVAPMGATGASAPLQFGNHTHHHQPHHMSAPPTPHLSPNDVDMHSMDTLQRKLSQEAQRLAQLEAEEAQLAAEERALQAQLRDTTAQHRNIDAAMYSMQHEWAEVHAAERALRVEPVIDLSADIARAEGAVEALRARFEEVVAQHDVMQAQLQVVAQVEATKKAQRDRLDAVERMVKSHVERRAALVRRCEANAELEAARGRIVADAAALLERAETTLARQQRLHQQEQQAAKAAAAAPTTTPAGLPTAVKAAPPALKGSRAAAAAAAAASRATSIASANLIPANSRAASCASQAARAAAPVDDGGMSFALDVEDDDALTASQPDVDLDMGGVSFVFPTASMATGAKRHRNDSVASAIVA
uniref:Uncharacterized protein n=1 Tax=Neobodo designis TaxID=312471 RepID=A0A7S1LPB5_NEODS|mmetsp:Transcript_25886/g.79941  ORF Transcript_25886/g.79941 Transcript_25886/m.79941 type:complete len:464 (+) Transcript_25886:125-1516(+)